jgi:hypothetical protein
LDADEIMAGDAPTSAGWASMLDAPDGTVLCFEKPDLFGSPSQCIRYHNPWPLGYVDDGAPHVAKKVHSLRLPVPTDAMMYGVPGVKILHYALTRFDAQAAKHRLYSVVENVAKLGSLFGRREAYGKKIADYIRGGRLEASPLDWFASWEALGIDMRTIAVSEYYWQDFEVLRYFNEYGEQRFWMEDIWSFDWEKCRLFARAHGVGNVPDRAIQPPHGSLKVALGLLDRGYVVARSVNRALGRSGSRSHDSGNRPARP